MTYAPQVKISFQCPACRKQFTAPSSAAGRQVRCSGCGGSVTVPHPGAAPPGAAATRSPAAAPNNSPSAGPIAPSLPSESTSKQPSNPVFKILGTAGVIVFVVLIVGGVGLAFRSASPRGAERSGHPERNFWSSRKTKTVQIKVGTATITDDIAGTSHVRVLCNNGLVIDADWKRNPFNDFGYDIYEPSVNRSYNRLAVMMTARGVIAAYLRGEYD